MTVPVGPAEWAWQRQSVWSQTADRLKAGPARLRRWALALTVLVAATALAASQLETVASRLSVSLAVLTAVGGTGVAVLRGTQSKQSVQRWTRARSVAEAMKRQVFHYLTRSGGYERGDRDRRLEAAVLRLESDVGDLERYTTGVAAKARPLPDVGDVESYLEHRVRQQVEAFYEPRADELGRRLARLRAVEVALALSAAARGARAAGAPAGGAWAGVAPTPAAAGGAHAAAERYEFLVVEYRRTARQLRYLSTRRVGVDGEALSATELVRECERVISIQNLGWMAKWSDEPGPEPRPRGR